MEKAIIDLIDRKAAKKLQDMTACHRETYRRMLYAGVQCTLNGCTVNGIASELGFSNSYTSELVHKFIQLLIEGNVLVNQINLAYHKLPKEKRYQHPSCRISPSKNIKQEELFRLSRNVEKLYSTHTAKGLQPATVKKLDTLDEMQKMVQQVSKEQAVPEHKVLGFIITRDELAMERAAVRDAIRFFCRYSKRPSMDTEPSEIWLSLHEAANYCGVPMDVIRIAAKEHLIRSCELSRTSAVKTFGYAMGDLDVFIKNQNLL